MSDDCCILAGATKARRFSHLLCTSATAARMSETTAGSKLHLTAAVSPLVKETTLRRSSRATSRNSGSDLHSLTVETSCPTISPRSFAHWRAIWSLASSTHDFAIVCAVSRIWPHISTITSSSRLISGLFDCVSAAATTLFRGNGGGDGGGDAKRPTATPPGT